MQKMLSRTVTVGTKYALHIWTGYVTLLAVLLATFLILAANGQNFVIVAWVVIGYSVVGIIVSTWALSRIQNKAVQIREDLNKLALARYFNGRKR